MDILNRLDEAAACVRQRLGDAWAAAVVLGSGLGGFASRVEDARELDYNEIPHFPVSTVEGHAGKLIGGRVAGKRLLVMAGRFHYYEGYSMEQVTFGIRVLHRLGVKVLLLSNAGGGVNPAFRPGDVMLITDHINLMPNPLVGPNIEELGPRFPNMSDAYSPRLADLARHASALRKVPLTQGCYLGSTGPTFETPHEYNFFRTIGADAVGMSTVPEVIVARHCGMEVLAFSVISNVGGLYSHKEVSHQEVQEVGALAEKRLTELILGVLETM